MKLNGIEAVETAEDTIRLELSEVPVERAQAIAQLLGEQVDVLQAAAPTPEHVEPPGDAPDGARAALEQAEREATIRAEIRTEERERCAARCERLKAEILTLGMDTDQSATEQGAAAAGALMCATVIRGLQ